MNADLNQFQICWIVAGWILGYCVPQLVIGTMKQRTPWLFDFAFGFVGGMIAWTLVK